MPPTAPLRRIRRLLVANRGEIAVRVMRTAQSRGIVCIAVYSEPDSQAQFVQMADEAVALSGVTSAQSYLDSRKVLEAARLSRADALHPGYGFLSENAAFAEQVIEEGITWVGPPPAAIAAMAEKVPAKRLVADAGVPLVPGAELPDGLTEGEVQSVADRVGYPLMVKASAGGGGKGMRVVEDPSAVVEAVAAAAREATAAFGDGTVFLERYLPEARHIEVQVFADDHGRTEHLFERECSIQRRHQKIIEEAPAAFLDGHVRSSLHAAAVAAARAIDYRGAGTVEFLVDGQDFYFLEMNTRLQVEHPVTEAITGLDLVSLQLDVAEGRALPPLPSQPRGHAIEARVYAEDPRNDDLPSVGRLHRFEVDQSDVRVDSGFQSGDQVSPYYDPMLAKVIAHGSSRDVAASTLEGALRSARIHGVLTNRDLLVAILGSPAFLDEPTSTAFLTRHAQLREHRPAAEVTQRHALAAAAAWWEHSATGLPDVADGAVPAGWRNVERPGGISVVLTGVGAEVFTGGRIAVHRSGGASGNRWAVAPAAERAGEHSDEVAWRGVAITARADAVADHVDVVVVEDSGLRLRCDVTIAQADDGQTQIWVDDPQHHTWWTVDSPLRADTSAGAGHGPSAPVPGTVAAVMVSAGDEVEEGQTLVVVEAMKMEHRITADSAGTVEQVHVGVGDSVEAHQLLVSLGEAEPDTAGEGRA